MTSVAGRFSISEYFSSQLGGFTLLPNPDFFGLASNYAQSTFGSANFVQTPDSLFVTLIVQYGVILTALVLLCLYFPLVPLGLNFFSSLISLEALSLSTNSLLGLGMLLGTLPLVFTANILESYPFVFFLSFLYSSPLLSFSRVRPPLR